MRVPNESLDDFASRADRRDAEPPPVVSPRRSGEIEVLKPLAQQDDLAKANAAGSNIFNWPALLQLSAYHRSIALGGFGAAIAFMLVMSIYFGFYALPVEQAASPADPGAIGLKKRPLTPPKAPNPFDHLAVTSSPPVLDETLVMPSAVFKPRPVRHTLRASYRVRRVEHRPQLAMTRFVPTTLIIYVEKGEVKSRIEPQLTAAYKKSVTTQN